MRSKNPLNGIIILSLFILLFLPSDIFSQTNTNNQDVAEFMAVKLKQKVILTDEQTAKVKIILSNYIEHLNDGTYNLDKAKKDIESLLNEKQKAKYDIIKDDFFNELNKKASNKSE